MFLPVRLSLSTQDLVKNLQASTLVRLIGRGASISQGLSADIERGPLTTIIVDGVQSQKQATFSAARVEATDRSGSTDVEANGLLSVASELIKFTELEEIRAVGVNFEVVLDSPTGESVGSFIVRKFIAEPVRAMPGQSSTSALGARLLYHAENGHLSTVSVESRFNDPVSSEITISLNTNSHQSRVPGMDEMKALYREGAELLDSFLGYLDLSSVTPAPLSD